MTNAGSVSQRGTAAAFMTLLGALATVTLVTSGFSSITVTTARTGPSNLRAVPPSSHTDLQPGRVDLKSDDTFQNEVEPAAFEKSPVVAQRSRQLISVKDSEELRAALVRLAKESVETSWELRLESPMIELSSPLVIPAGKDVRIVTASASGSVGGGGDGLAALMARDDTSLFIVNQGASLELSNVALHGGTADEGGAISADKGARVSLSGCLLANHTARGRGGAIFSRGGVGAA
mmetsp:Transcript_4219/g.8986  ORF Transcript_4219/g.8986 Transcript_4219/m.8986 type:complete len:235 (+) Transcript_4219:226-930(+)